MSSSNDKTPAVHPCYKCSHCHTLFISQEERETHEGMHNTFLLAALPSSAEQECIATQQKTQDPSEVTVVDSHVKIMITEEQPPLGLPSRSYASPQSYVPRQPQVAGQPPEGLPSETTPSGASHQSTGVAVPTDDGSVADLEQIIGNWMSLFRPILNRHIEDAIREFLCNSPENVVPNPNFEGEHDLTQGDLPGVVYESSGAEDSSNFSNYQTWHTGTTEWQGAGSPYAQPKF